ncbi:MAG: hypothetical protein ACFCVD_03465 [Nodosilinea sp.]
MEIAFLASEVVLAGVIAALLIPILVKSPSPEVEPIPVPVRDRRS